MIQVNEDQYAELKKKEALSAEEQAVVDAMDAVKAAEEAQPMHPETVEDANKTLVTAQEALKLKPSTTV